MTTRARPRLLVVGETAVPTGYARVADSLLGLLESSFDIHQLSTWAGTSLPSPGTWTTSFHTGETSLADRFAERLGALRPHLVLILHDLRTVAALAGPLEARGAAVRAVSYSPLDVVRPKHALVHPARTMDVVVAYTGAQAGSLREVFGDGGSVPRIEVIPHGVDTGRFHPLEGGAPGQARASVRGPLFGDRCAPGAFVVLNANRNHLRKRLDVTVEAFALFARSRPDTMLCLHSGPRDPMGWDLHSLAARHGVADRLLLTAPDAMLPDASDEHLNRVYNACDVGLNTSVGEGWGLPSFEHAATRAAQVVPDHTACGDLWRGHGVLVPATGPVPTIDPHRDEQRVHAEDVARALGALYDDRSALERCSDAAYRLATEERYAWSRVAEQWRALLHPLTERG